MSFLILIQISLYLVGIIHSLVCGGNCFLVLKMVLFHILFYILMRCFVLFFVFKVVLLLSLFNLKFRTKFIGNQVFINDETRRFVDEEYHF